MKEEKSQVKELKRRLRPEEVPPVAKRGPRIEQANFLRQRKNDIIETIKLYPGLTPAGLAAIMKKKHKWINEKHGYLRLYNPIRLLVKEGLLYEVDDPSKGYIYFPVSLQSMQTKVLTAFLTQLDASIPAWSELEAFKKKCRELAKQTLAEQD